MKENVKEYFLEAIKALKNNTNVKVKSFVLEDKSIVDDWYDEEIEIDFGIKIKMTKELKKFAKFKIANEDERFVFYCSWNGEKFMNKLIIGNQYNIKDFLFNYFNNPNAIFRLRLLKKIIKSKLLNSDKKVRRRDRYISMEICRESNFFNICFNVDNTESEEFRDNGSVLVDLLKTLRFETRYRSVKMRSRCQILNRQNYKETIKDLNFDVKTIEDVEEVFEKFNESINKIDSKFENIIKKLTEQEYKICSL